jgi:hypothetical protein
MELKPEHAAAGFEPCWGQCGKHAETQRDEVLSALKALVARAEREMVDPIDVGEIQWAKELIAKVESR